jgi:hypothetical protein
MKALLVVAGALLVALLAVGALTAPDAATPGRSGTTSAVGPMDQATLQQDAWMTQQMSMVGANGPMQTYSVSDPQLVHSQNPAFVRQLEQYQAEIDRMLARPRP